MKSFKEEMEHSAKATKEILDRSKRFNVAVTDLYYSLCRMYEVIKRMNKEQK